MTSETSTRRTYPATFAQQRLWFLDQMEPGGTAYLIPWSIRLTGDLHVRALERTLQELVRRHEILRTTFSMPGREVVQEVHEFSGFPLIIAPLMVEDLSGSEDPAAAAQQRAVDEKRQPLDLAEGPLIRWRLLRLSAAEHVLLITLHHILFDGASRAILIREFSAIYDAFREDRPCPLAPPRLQYGAYAAWQHSNAGQRFETDLAYWKKRLADAPAVLSLPTDRPRPAIETFRGGIEKFALPKTLSDGLVQLARRSRASLFMVLLAAFDAMLAKYSGQDDIVVGVPTAGRTREELEGLIGYCANQLALRLELTGNPTFREIVARMRNVALDAFDHQELPLDLLVREVNPERSLSHNPLFQVLFAMRNFEREELRLAGLETSWSVTAWDTAKFDLSVLVTEGAEGLSGWIEYNTDLYDAPTIARMLGHYQVLLEAAVANPDLRLSELPLLTPAETRQIEDWNDTAHDYPADTCLHEFIERQVELRPDAPAVRFEASELSYRELNARANRLAHYLRSIGVGPDEIVAISAERSLEMVIGMVATLKAGGAYLPIDPDTPHKRFSLILEDAKPKAILTLGRLAHLMPATALPILPLDTWWHTVEGEADVNPVLLTRGHHAVYVIYTSGSTGIPKGVVNIHSGIVNRLMWIQEVLPMYSSDRLLQKTPFTFDVSVWEFFWPLVTGACLVVSRPEGHKDPCYLIDVITREKITTIHFVPSMLRIFLESEDVEQCTSLRRVLASGEALGKDLEQRFTERLGAVELHNLYGPTEASVEVTWWPCCRGDRASSVPIGFPIWNTQIQILDAELRPVPVGVAGELHIGGVQVARGYLNRPELTHERFIPDPFRVGGRLYKTGDRARWRPDGAVEYLGRMDFQVKIRGFRIELGEIESILGQHPEVKECVVVAREDLAGDPRIVAYVVPGSRNPLAIRLREYLGEKLPEYMAPSAFVFLDALPVSSNGKLDRKALPRPEYAREETTAYVAPRTPVEVQVAAVWSEVLQVARIGVADNFFQLGGHSLIGTQAISRIRKEFAVDLRLRALFEAPTVAGLAERVEALLRERGEVALLRERRAVALPRLERSERHGPPRLSFPQKRLWFLDQMGSGSALYNTPFVVRLRGPLQAEALDWSLQEIVRRHEVLRTRFEAVNGEPVQVIDPSMTMPFTVRDLTALPEAERESEARRLASEEAERPFDLAAGPLVRARLIRIAPQDHVLVVNTHHIVSDGWSLGVLWQEIAALYPAFLRSAPAALPELAVQYADFSTWQHEFLAGEQLSRQLAYWKSRLEGAAQLEFPTDRPRPAVETFHGGRHIALLPAGLLSGLKDLGQRQGVTLFMTMLGALNVLLARYTGQDDIVVGSFISGRNRPEIERLIGFFVNSLVMRTRLDGNPTFLEVLARVCETALGADANQDVPFEKLVEELQPVRDLSRNPLFQIMLAMQNMPGPAVKLPGIAASSFPVREIFSKFDLTLYCSESPDGLRIAAEYNTDLFDASTIERFLGHLQTLLEAAVANPGLRLSELPLLTPWEKQQLAAWNDTAHDFPRDASLHQFIERQAELTPEAPAVRFEFTELSYREFNARANRLAHHLRSLGVGPESIVAVCAERSIEMVIALVATLKAGGAYLPIDPDTPLGRMSMILEDAQPKAILTLGRLAHVLPETVTPVFILDGEWPSQPETNPVALTRGESAAYLIYTSGSTGVPKGVTNVHSAIVNQMLWMQSAFPLDGTDRVMQKTPYTFDVSLWEFFWPLMTGACLVVARPEGHKDPNYLVDLIARERITTIVFVPSLLRMFLESDRLAGCTSLKRVLTIGEALTRDIEQKFYEKLFTVELHNLYGPTEAAVSVTWWPCGRGDQVASLPIGHPEWNTQVYILDEHLQQVPVGVAGELHIGGVQLARGYLNRPELTDEKFIPNPFGEGRLYKTGDSARYRADGAIEYLGRMDFQVKFRGFRIELGEIETVLGQHRDVKQCVAVVREEQLAAYVVAREGATLSIAELRRLLQMRLPEYMVPAAFVQLPSMPLSTAGKIDRKALPAPERTAHTAEYAAPRNPTEEVLAGIWADVLKFDRVSVEDSFFELGGHSLLATRVVSRIRNAFRIELPLRALFEEPRIAGLAKRVDAFVLQNLGVEAPPLTRADRSQPLPLSFAQQRLWFIDQLEPGNPIYNVPRLARIRGPLDPAILERALQEVIRRHEVLRTTFADLDGRPVQVIAPALEAPLPVVDLLYVPEDSRETECLRIAAEEARRPFDLAAGPLLRLTVFRLDPEHHFLLLVMHHIVTERWSQSLLWRELSLLYDAFLDGRPSPLPDLAFQYADYAAWQREWVERAALGPQLDYWKKQLAGAPPVLELPTDRPRPAVPSHRGAFAACYLAPELVTGLNGLTRAENATFFMTMLAAFQAMLGRYTGQNDLVVGSIVAGRTSAEFEPLIGFFVNTVALRADLSGDPPFREFLRRVRETALDSYAHQDVPFERVVEELSPERNPGHNPIFQVAFAYDQAVRPLQMSGLDVEAMPMHQGAAVFDLTWYVVEAPLGIRLFIEYNTDLFDASTIERMLGHYQVLLEGVSANPDLRLSELPLLTAAEQQQLAAWNNAAPEYPRDASVHQFIERQVELTPDAPAVRFEGAALSYRELNARANRLAHYLRSQGVGPDDIVGICAERSFEMLVAALGTLKASCAYLPIDPDLPLSRVALMLEDARPKVILTLGRLAHLLPPYPVPVFQLDADWPSLDGQPSTNPVPLARGEHAVSILFTSGSTGIPKGVVSLHSGLTNRLMWLQDTFPIGPADRVMQKTAYTFDISIWEFFWPLMNGACVVMARPAAHMDPVYLIDLIESEKISSIVFVPSMLQALLDTEGVEEKCQSLRLVFSVGEALTHELEQRFFEKVGAVLWNFYGPTEASVGITTWVCRRGDSGGTAPVGYPIGNAKLYILDRAMQPVPVGVAGELYTGGVGLAREYVNRPDLTADQFIPNPFEPGGRLYKTGDLVRYRPDGAVDYLGRIDFQVKIRGFRVEMGEIQAVLSQHPAVRECVVVARKEGLDKQLVAYIVGRDGAVISRTELRQLLQMRLPDYMIPGAFVQVPSMPLTTSGKINRLALPAPEETAPSDADFVAPRNPAEEMIAGIWADVLKLDHVSVEDNFFELGGHSLLAAQVISRIRRSLLRDVPLRALFEHPTVAALASLALAPSAEAATPPIVRVGRDLPLPLSYSQQRLWLVDQLQPGNPLYNVSLTFRLGGELHVDALETALRGLLERHEILRTTYRITHDGPVQVIDPAAAISLHIIDLTGEPSECREPMARIALDREAQKPFDLASGPMLRATLAKLGDEEHVLILTTHHIAIDGWSNGILRRDLAALYEAAVRNEAANLPELPVQYADYAWWQRQWLTGPILEKQLSAWKSVLAGAPPVLALPADRPRPSGPHNRGTMLRAVLPASLSEQVVHLSRQQNVTPFMALLAGFESLVFYLTGQSDIVLGTDVAGRTHLETEALIGALVNLLPVRVNVSGDPTFAELLARVRAVGLDAYSRQEVPFDKLVEAMEPDRELADNPLVQVLFVQQNVPRHQAAMDGLRLTGFELGVTSKFDLAVFLTSANDTFTGNWVFDPGMFDAGRIERMAALYQAILEKVVQQPAARLSALAAFMAEAEQQKRSEGHQQFQQASMQKLRKMARRPVAIPETGIPIASGDLIQ